MGLVFFCQSCGARFEVDPRMAGKKGRCKKCGQLMEIPRAEQVASMAAIPALVGAGGPDGASPPKSSWIDGSLSGAMLAPITADRIPVGRMRAAAKPTPSPLDDAEDSKPYALARPVRGEMRGRPSGRPNLVMMHWRRQLGHIQKLFRKLNEFAYLVSVPFLMVLLFGTVVRSRPIALLGATAVVLLNLGRLAAGVANLAVIPFRDGLDARKMKKPFRRVVEPVATIGLVVLAFTFIPWLHSGDAARGSLGARLRTEASDLRREMKGEVETVLDKAKGVDVEGLRGRAKEGLRDLEGRARKSFDPPQEQP